jgi:hypothetical protein
MNNMYDILKKFNTVADSQTLTEGRAVQEADVEEGNRFTGELAKARAAGKKQADLDGDGDMEPVKEAKKAKPDFLDMDRDGDKKEPMKKAIKDKAKKKSVKESLRLIKEADLGDRSLKVYHDREYQEYHVCVTEGNQVISREFAGSTQEVTQLVRGIIAEARGSALAISPLDDPRTQFRKRFAPSVMRDPESRAELGKLDTEYSERSKTAYGRGEEEDEDDEGKKKDKPAGEKRGRGRPKGAKRRIGAKGPTGRSKLLTREDYDADEYDEEGEMAKSQARTIEDAAEELQSILTADENLPEWVQKKITLAKEYIDSARDYLKANRPAQEPMAEDQDQEGPADLMAAVDEEYNQPGRHIDNLQDVMNATFDSDSSPEFERARAIINRYLELVTNTDVDHYDPEDDDEPRIRRMTHGNLARHVREYDLGDYLAAAYNELSKAIGKKSISEKAVSKAQRAAAGIAYAAKKGDIPKSELRGASKEMARMPAGELKKFAKTKEKGLPEKVKEVDTGEADARKTSPSGKESQQKTFDKFRERSKKEKAGHDKEQKEKPVKETTTAGSVATAPAEGGKKSKGGIQFGKGVYEARLAEQFEREMKSIMNEGLDVSVTANADGSNTVSVTGKDVTPDVLIDLLKMAGMSGAREEVYQPVQTAPGGDDMAGMLDALDGIAGGQPHQPESMIPEQEVCEVCGAHEGMHEAGCDREMALEADLANSADNTEIMSADYMVNGLSGGVNGPKLQVNPNNEADNPLAMPDLASSAHSLNLGVGAVAEDIERQLENRLLDLYRKL